MNNQTWILLGIEAIMFIGIIIGVKSCDNSKINNIEQNLIASRDTIEVLQMKNGDLVYEKSLYILKEKELLEQLDITKSELNDIKDKIGDPVVITKTETKLQFDTIWSTKDSIIYRDIEKNEIITSFDYKDEWLSLNGKTYINDSISKTQINNIKVPVPLTIGITDDYKFFASSKNPYLTITSIEGSLIENKTLNPKKQKISHGFTISAGPQYNIITGKFDIGVQAGYGIMFNF